MKKSHYLLIVFMISWLGLACSPLAQTQSSTPTPTPTKTPTPIETPTPEPTAVVIVIEPTATETPIPTATPLPEPTATPVPAEPTATPTEETPPTDTPEPELPTDTPEPELPTNTPVPVEPTNTPEPTSPPEPEVAYKIIHYRVLGDGENNGGIFNKGGQHHIFVTVVDAAGQGIDGAIIKDANGVPTEWVTGNKGPGKTEIDMNYDPFKLYVAADPSGPTTSEVSNQMNTLYPHIPDIIGKLGTVDNEYSVCPTVDIRCEPPFYNVHFSYEITFQKVQ